MRSVFFMLPLLGALAASAEQRSADLDKAARLVFDQKYEAAARALEVAWRQTGNKRETVLRILELQGVVYAQLGQETKAKNAFQMLLALDPKRELSGKYSNKVMQPFAEAEAWATQNPPLEVTAEPAALDGKGKVLQIAVKVKSDPLKLVRKVRFSSRPESGKWVEKLVDVQGAYASADTDSDGLEWWAELVGDREMVLAQVGSQRAPVKEGKLREKDVEAATPPVVEKKDRERDKDKDRDRDRDRDKPADAPVAERTTETKPRESKPMQIATTVEPSGGSELMRAVGYSSLVLGVVSLIVGSASGIMSRSTVNDINARIEGATREDGVIVSLPDVMGPPQLWVYAATDRAKTQAVIANVAWGVGSGLAILGVVLVVLGRDSADVSAGAGGLAVAW